MAYNNVKRSRNDVDNNRNHNQEQYPDSLNEDLKRKRPENLVPNHVLLFTIVNPLYPITVHVLNTICSPIGPVQRIVIFKKNGVQAMVEFDSVETAKRAKESLNGADIYSGCCTLKIEFAKPTKLNVHKNDNDSWDYTLTPGNKPDSNRPAPLLADPRFGAGPQPYPHGRSNQFKGRNASYDDDYGEGPRGGHGGGSGYMDHYDDGYHNDSSYDHYGERFPPVDGGFMNGNRRYMGGGGRGGDPMHSGPAAGRGGNYGLLTPTGPPGPTNGTQNSSSGCVMMVYGLDKEKVNADKLFNLFCLYGNVIKVKFLKTKEGCAMIQMGDTISVERCISNLNNFSVGDMKVQLGFSKQPFLSDVTMPYTLPDNNPSFKDFHGSKNNRFMNPSMAIKNRIQGPSKVLHFFNAPPHITEETLKDIFEKKCEMSPEVQLFPMKGDRSSSGLVKFDSVEEALVALMECNHIPVNNPSGKFPYVLKLCFSSNRFPLSFNYPKSEPEEKSE